jgi:hypothetical protein
MSVARESDGGFTIVYGLTRPEAIFCETMMNTGGFFMCGFTRDQKIISKEEVMDSWGSSSNFQTFKMSISFFSKQQMRKNFST